MESGPTFLWGGRAGTPQRGLPSSAAPQVAPHQRHWPEDRLAKPSCIDADRPFERVGDGLTPGGAPHDVCKGRQIRKADGQLEGDDGLLPCAEWEPERKRSGGCARAFEKQRTVERSERQPKWIRIGDLRPQADHGPAEWPRGRGALERHLCRLLARLSKPWRLHQLAQPAQRFTCLDDEDGAQQSRESGQYHHGPPECGLQTARLRFSRARGYSERMDLCSRGFRRRLTGKLRRTAVAVAEVARRKLRAGLIFAEAGSHALITATH